MLKLSNKMKSIYVRCEPSSGTIIVQAPEEWTGEQILEELNESCDLDSVCERTFSEWVAVEVIEPAYEPDDETPCAGDLIYYDGEGFLSGVPE